MILISLKTDTSRNRHRLSESPIIGQLLIGRLLIGRLLIGRLLISQLLITRLLISRLLIGYFLFSVPCTMLCTMPTFRSFGVVEIALHNTGTLNQDLPAGALGHFL